MHTDRNQFLVFLAKECSGLNYVFLNYTFNSIFDIHSSDKLELLIDKEDYASLLYVISSGKDISKIKTKKVLYAQVIDIKFTDHSSLSFQIKTTIERNGIVLMNSSEILKESVYNEQHIKTPSPRHLFEYIVIYNLLQKKNVEDKIVNFFNAFSKETRAKIFAHIVPKYNFVINVLDELYFFGRTNYRKAHSKIGLSKQNRGLNFFIHKISFSISFVKMSIMNTWEQLLSQNVTVSGKKAVPNQIRAFLLRKAIIKNL